MHRAACARSSLAGALKAWSSGTAAIENRPAALDATMRWRPHSRRRRSRGGLVDGSRTGLRHHDAARWRSWGDRFCSRRRCGRCRACCCRWSSARNRRRCRGGSCCFRRRSRVRRRCGWNRRSRRRHRRCCRCWFYGCWSRDCRGCVLRLGFRRSGRGRLDRDGMRRGRGLNGWMRRRRRRHDPRLLPRQRHNTARGRLLRPRTRGCRFRPTADMWSAGMWLLRCRHCGFGCRCGGDRRRCGRRGLSLCRVRRRCHHLGASRNRGARSCFGSGRSLLLPLLNRLQNVAWF